MTGLPHIRHFPTALAVSILTCVLSAQLSNGFAAAATVQTTQLTPLQTSGLADTHRTGSFNPAAGSAGEYPFASLWRRSYFSVSDLRASGVRLNVRTRLAAVGLGVSHMGIDGLSNTSLVVSFSRQIGSAGEPVSLTGLSLILDRFGARNRQPVTRTFLRGAVISSVSEGTRLAVLLNQPIRSGSGGVRDGGFAVLGLEIDISETVTAFFDYFKERSMPESIRTGVRIRPFPDIILGSGIALDPDEFFGHIEIHSGKYLFRIDASRHPYLGWSRSFSLGFL
jgi:hypothetical protein